MGYQHGKVVFTGWARGDIIENMLKDHRSADYNDGKITDVSSAPNTSATKYPEDWPCAFSHGCLAVIFCLLVLHVSRR